MVPFYEFDAVPDSMRTEYLLKVLQAAIIKGRKKG
jgi:hypothetical protein